MGDGDGSRPPSLWQQKLACLMQAIHRSLRWEEAAAPKLASPASRRMGRQFVPNLSICIGFSGILDETTDLEHATRRRVVRLYVSNDRLHSRILKRPMSKRIHSLGGEASPTEHGARLVSDLDLPMLGTSVETTAPHKGALGQCCAHPIPGQPPCQRRILLELIEEERQYFAKRLRWPIRHGLHIQLSEQQRGDLDLAANEFSRCWNDLEPVGLERVHNV